MRKKGYVFQRWKTMEHVWNEVEFMMQIAAAICNLIAAEALLGEKRER